MMKRERGKNCKGYKLWREKICARFLICKLESGVEWTLNREDGLVTFKGIGGHDDSDNVTHTHTHTNNFCWNGMEVHCAVFTRLTVLPSQAAAVLLEW